MLLTCNDPLLHTICNGDVLSWSRVFICTPFIVRYLMAAMLFPLEKWNKAFSLSFKYFVDSVVNVP